jgi:hydroxyacylglutathione hydrolase
MSTPDKNTLNVSPIAAFKDNYIWALCDANKNVVVVDPGTASAVEDFLSANHYKLIAILITHHHPDHTGGIVDLCKNRDIQVFGPAGGHISGITDPVHDGDDVAVLGTHLRVMAVPGHTLDHLAYVLQMPVSGQAPDALSLFCGDTLFAGGCGRLFEGTADIMYNSLLRIGALPENTRIYCAHEYTLANLNFAEKAEPGNAAIKRRQEIELSKREQGLPTLPTTIFEELRTNPFLRCHSVSLKKQVATQMAQELHSNLETFMNLRRWKDQF